MKSRAIKIVDIFRENSIDIDDLFGGCNKTTHEFMMATKNIAD